MLRTETLCYRVQNLASTLERVQELTAPVGRFDVHITDNPVRDFDVVRNSSVGIATPYGLDGPWIESRWG